MKDRFPSASSRRLALLLAVGILFGAPRPAGCATGTPPAEYPSLAGKGPFVGTPARAPNGLQPAPTPRLIVEPARRLIVKEIPSQEGTVLLLEPAPKPDAAAPGSPVKQRRPASRPRIKRVRPLTTSTTRTSPPTASQPADPLTGDRRDAFESRRPRESADRDRAFQLPPVISAWPKQMQPRGFSGLPESPGLNDLPQIVPPARELNREPPPAAERSSPPAPEGRSSRAAEGSSPRLKDARGEALPEADGVEKPSELGSDSRSRPATQIPERLSRIPEDKPAVRSRDLELIARQADMHTRRGFALAGRGACFSARAEFVMALRILAQGLDAERQTGTHSRALAAGLTALKEAGDFVLTGSRLEADLDVPGIVAGHRTPVLKQAPSESLPPLTALRCYFTFAQEQLAVAAGRELAGSTALYGLGNLHRALAARRGSTVRAAMPKAMVFYQAALLVRPENYMASNELGVLLARAGRCEEARVALEHCVSVCRESAAWHNLAVVYRQLGRTGLAQEADRQCQAIRQAETARRKRRAPTSAHRVRWVDPSTFAGSDADVPAAEPPAASAGWPPPWTAPQTDPAIAKDVARSPLWDLRNKRD